jgi:hypothetical protein
MLHGIKKAALHGRPSCIIVDVIMGLSLPERLASWSWSLLAPLE